MEVDMLLNMDGFDDNMTPVFFTNSGSTTFTVNPVFSATTSSDSNPRSNIHPTTSYPQFCGPWPEANMYSYGLESYPHYATTVDTLHDPSLSHSDQTPSSHQDRLLTSTTRSREDASSWQMYISASLSDSLHSLDVDNIPDPDPGSLDLVYASHNLPHDRFPELVLPLESPSSSYQHTQTTTTNDVQPIYCTPLVAPQPRNIQPVLLSLMSTPQDPPLLAQSESSTKANERTVRTSSISNISTPKFDFRTAPSSPPFSPSRGRSSLVNNPPTRPKRGLTGWGSMDNLEPPAPPSSTSSHRKKPTCQSKSPNSSLKILSPPLLPSHGASRSSSRNSERLLKRLRKPDESPPNSKRASKTRCITVADIDSEDDGEGAGDSDSDDYSPSRSPSLNPSRSISPTPSFHSSATFQRDTESVPASVRQKKNKGKGKAKGSAALALAVVSQMIRDPSAGRRDNIDLTSTRYRVTRRKNHPIPLPIPVPNLNKKSRGRKVPHVAAAAAAAAANNNTATNAKSGETVKEEEDTGGDGEDESRSSTRSRRKPTECTTPPATAMNKSSSGESRTFVCLVSGCGKCFVRSEHLKRHVRSIHTHDKPHPCPFEGCKKSFSRRDNLGQHVRIHLQS